MTRRWGHLLRQQNASSPAHSILTCVFILSVRISHKLRKMSPYDDWNKLEEDEDEELQDHSVRAP